MSKFNYKVVSDDSFARKDVFVFRTAEWYMWRTLDLATIFTDKSTLDDVVETLWLIDMESTMCSKEGDTYLIPQSLYDFAEKFYNEFHNYSMFEGGLENNL